MFDCSQLTVFRSQEPTSLPSRGDSIGMQITGCGLTKGTLDERRLFLASKLPFRIALKEMKKKVPGPYIYFEG